MQFAITEIFQNNEKSTVKLFFNLKTQALAMFNRLLITYPAEVVQFIASNMNIEDFLITYVLNMDFISSEKARRINAFAILIMFDYVPQDVIMRLFEQMMRQIVPEVTHEVERKNMPQKANPEISMRRDVYSARKAELRTKQLYENVDLLSFFKHKIQVS